jgi:prophage antirepressor-like protein
MPSTAPSTAIQATTSVAFRVSGSKPSPVHVFAKGGRKWIVASEVCRILGIRTDTVPKLVPEQNRGHATLLTKGGMQSVITITGEGFNVLVARSTKPVAKALREWMTKEVLASVGKAPPSKVPEGQGELF